MKLSEVFSGISILIGIASLCSLIQLWLDVGLANLAGEFLRYYRVIANHTIGLPAKLLGFPLPQQLIDLWSISFVGASAYFRVPNVDQSRALRNFDLSAVPHWRVMCVLFFGITGLGVFFFYMVVSPFTYVDLMEEEQDLSRAAVRNFITILLGVVSFFLLNAFFPYSMSA